jgi:hypothetical protein
MDKQRIQMLMHKDFSFVHFKIVPETQRQNKIKLLGVGSIPTLFQEYA